MTRPQRRRCWGRPASGIRQRRWKACPEGGGSGWRWRRRWRAGPTCCCWTSPPTIWISRGSSGWRRRWRAPAWRRWSSATTGTSWKTWPHMMELNRAFPGGLFRVDGNYRRVSGEARAVLRGAGEGAGVARGKGAARDRVAAARCEGAHAEGEGARGGGAGDDRRAGAGQRPRGRGDGEDRFHRHGPAHEEAAGAGGRLAGRGRTRAVPRRVPGAVSGAAAWRGRAERQRQDELSAAAAGRARDLRGARCGARRRCAWSISSSTGGRWTRRSSCGGRWRRKATR